MEVLAISKRELFKNKRAMLELLFYSASLITLCSKLDNSLFHGYLNLRESLVIAFDNNCRNES